MIDRTYYMYKYLGNPVGTALGPSGNNLVFYWSDPAIWLMYLSRSWEYEYYKCAARSNEASDWTRVPFRNSIVNNFGRLLAVLSGRDPLYSVDFKLKWNPRVTVNHSGLYFPNSTVSMTSLSMFKTIGVADNSELVKNWSFPIWNNTQGGTFTNPEILWEFFRYLKRNKVEGQLKFECFYGGGSSLHAVTLSAIVVSDDLIRYTARLDSTLLSNPLNGGSATYNVEIYRNPGNPLDVRLKISNVVGWTLVNGALTKPVAQAQFNRSYLNALSGRESKDRNITLDPSWKIKNFTAGLFVSQGKAIVAQANKQSENFESFVESPGFLPTVFSVVETLKGGSKTVKDPKFFDPYRQSTKRVGLSYRDIAGIILAWLFAVRPFLESASDVVKRFFTSHRYTTGYGLVIYEGETDYASLPRTLRLIMQSFTTYPISFRVELRTTIRSKVTRNNMSVFLGELIAETQKLGIYPTATQLWAGLPYTWIVDMVLPISPTLDAVEARLSVLTRQNTRVGHSVFIDVTDKFGYRKRLFIRSDDSNWWLDAPNDIWVEPNPVYTEAIIPFIVQAVL